MRGAVNGERSTGCGMRDLTTVAGASPHGELACPDRTPLHFHGGDGLVTVLEGVMTLEVLGAIRHHPAAQP